MAENTRDQVEAFDEAVAKMRGGGRDRPTATGRGNLDRTSAVLNGPTIVLPKAEYTAMQQVVEAARLINESVIHPPGGNVAVWTPLTGALTALDSLTEEPQP